MLPHWLIEKKRDGNELAPDEIEHFIDGFTRGEIPEYQMAAMAMAIYFKGMTLHETVALTDVMMRSGDLVDTSSIPFPKIDKHSTGGIGDKVSLILAPLVACFDIAVPMISGRGLGITGGTLDKLESIPGYRVDLSVDEFLDVIGDCGCSVIGQTADLAPADKKLYALRDVTGTVPSIPLIVASIMSKKLAEGIDSLVLDVKWGAGAFMKSVDDAMDLARVLVSVGHRMGKRMAAVITDMNQPLGRTVGNALEVRETIEALAGNGPDDLMEVTLALASQMLQLGGRAGSHVRALEMLNRTLAGGEALERFARMVARHGGDVAVVSQPDRLPVAPIRREILATRDGYLARCGAEEIGRASIILGGGRQKTTDAIDHAVGISGIRKVGDHVAEGETVAVLHAADEASCGDAQAYLERAFDYCDHPVTTLPLIVDTLDPERTNP